MALDLKGIQVGKKSDENAIFQAFHASKATGWTGETTIAGKPAKARLDIAADGTVNSIQITFASDDFAEIEIVARQKFHSLRHHYFNDQIDGKMVDKWYDADGSSAGLYSQFEGDGGALFLQTKASTDAASAQVDRLLKKNADAARRDF